MQIQRLTEEECYAALNKTGFGRLACARDDQPYVVPVYFVVGDQCLYSFALPGQKIEWMRTNRRVCLECDTVGGGDDWTSVVAFGLYQELSDTDEYQRERMLAHRRSPGPWRKSRSSSPHADQTAPSRRTYAGGCACIARSSQRPRAVSRRPRIPAAEPSCGCRGSRA